MMAGTNVMVTVASSAAKVRCPHLLFHNVLGTETVSALLDYVTARERDFEPAVVWRRQSGRIDRAVRDCYYLWDLGKFEASFRGLLDGIVAHALHQLGLFEPAVEASEFEICAFGHGGHFTPHIDTLEKLKWVRILSCVYYFAATPRRFSGGILRLYGFPTSSAKGGPAPQTVDIMPETDSLVVFPSWLWHEVLAVEVPSKAWADGRFTINCWVHRINPSADAAPTAC
jgi:hypothetical protein